jgi:hypothetical protein
MDKSMFGGNNMQRSIASILNNIKDGFKLDIKDAGREEYDDETLDFLDEIKQAREEWIAAQNFFENATDPDLIDYAIYRIEATRRRYMYLIKQAKKADLEDKFILIQ